MMPADHRLDGAFRVIMNVATMKTGIGNTDQGGWVSLSDQASDVDSGSESIRDKVEWPMMDDLDDEIVQDFLIAQPC